MRPGRAPRPAHGPPAAADTAIALLADARPTLLSTNLVAFGRLLRAAGFDVTPGRLLDAARALELVGIAAQDDARVALRATLVSDVSRLALFDALFDAYWRGDETPALPLARDDPAEAGRSEMGAGRDLVALLAGPLHDPAADSPDSTAGATDLLTTKDFANYDDADVHRARRLVRVIAPRLASALARRRRRSRRGDEIDLRRSLRRAARRDGDIVDLVRRRRRVRRLRLVVLCDVSGSMDRYSRALVQFLFALQNELRGVSTFVFSTRLHDITRLLKTRSYDEALARAGRDVDAWSGGTSIGGCLEQFERRHARTRLDSRTVLVIVSDGWERGDPAQLRRAMAAIRRRAYRIIWLNPLLGAPGYRPLARGMATALPYVDHFLPAHSLDALAGAVRTIGSLAGGSVR